MGYDGTEMQLLLDAGTAAWQPQLVSQLSSLEGFLQLYYYYY